MRNPPEIQGQVSGEQAVFTGKGSRNFWGICLMMKERIWHLRLKKS